MNLDMTAVSVSVSAAQGFDARLEGSSAPFHFVPNELSLKGTEVRGQRGEAGVTGLEHFVERHADLVLSTRAYQMKASSLRERDIQLRVCGPKVDRNGLEHEAEPLIEIGAIRLNGKLGDRCALRIRNEALTQAVPKAA